MWLCTANYVADLSVRQCVRTFRRREQLYQTPLGNCYEIKSNMTLIMVDKPQPSYNLLNVIK